MEERKELLDVITWWNNLTRTILILFVILGLWFLYVLWILGFNLLLSVGEHSMLFFLLIALLLGHFITAVYASQTHLFYIAEYKRKKERTKQN